MSSMEISVLSSTISRAPLVGVQLLHLLQLGADDLVDLALVAEDLLVARDLLQHLVALLEDLVALQSGEALQAHVEDGLRLDLGELELLHQAGLRGRRIFGGADQLDHRVEVVERDLQAVEDVQALLGLAQLEDRAPRDHLLAVADEDLQGVLEGEQLRPVVDDGQHDDAEGLLHRRQLVELVEHDVRVGVALQLDDDAHAVAVRLVAQVGDAVDPLVVHQLGHALDQARLVHLVRDLLDDDRDAPAALVGLGAGAGAQLQDAPTGVVDGARCRGAASRTCAASAARRVAA